MRIQQKENNIYVKTLDNIDSYLINIINRYFQDDKEDIRLNVENIINESIRRMKEDLDIIIEDLLLKNSVTSVNGQNVHVDPNAPKMIVSKTEPTSANIGDVWISW